MTIKEKLMSVEQGHLIPVLDSLEGKAKENLETKINEIDWEELKHPAEAVSIESVTKSKVITNSDIEARRKDLEDIGEKAYQNGEVAILMVAGGQGSRLGFSGPKGCYIVGKHSGKSIYQLQAEKVLSLSKRVGKDVPFLVMTSPMTDAESKDFFAVHDNFGLKSEQVIFFSQGTVPSVDEDGKVLLSAKDKLLENPDGHGGCHTALVNSGTLAKMKSIGIKQIVFIQVDNILAPVDDSLLVGLASVEKSEVIVKVLEKVEPDEKVGHLVKIAGNDSIIEYTELTPEETRLKYKNEELIYRWGSPSMYAWSVDFLDRLSDDNFKLPLHRSSKPLKAWKDGEIKETKGWKSERFIFDLIPASNLTLGLQIDRLNEFAPIKNKTGVDSVESACELTSQLYTKWLKKAGVEVKEGSTIEIGPLFAATEQQFLAKWDNRLSSIEGDYYLEEKE